MCPFIFSDEEPDLSRRKCVTITDCIYKRTMAGVQCLEKCRGERHFIRGIRPLLMVNVYKIKDPAVITRHTYITCSGCVVSFFCLYWLSQKEPFRAKIIYEARFFPLWKIFLLQNLLSSHLCNSCFVPVK